MLPRVWTCVEPPWWSWVLAASVSPIVISVLCALGFAAGLLRRKQLSKLLLRIAAISGSALAVGVLALGVTALTIARTGANPSSALRSASWIGAALGAASLLTACRDTKSRWGRLLELEVAHPIGVRRLATFVGLGCASAFAIALGVGQTVSDLSLWSIPYRTFEYMVPDQIVVIASDECLAARVLEYGSSDPHIGDDASRKLFRRGASATVGVAAKLEEVRTDWPPRPYKVTENGLEWLLDFLRQHGDSAQVALWEKFDWKEELRRANDAPEPVTLRHAHWAAP